MEIELVAIVTCPKCGIKNTINNLDIYLHEYDEYDSEHRCDGKLICSSCGYEEEFRHFIY
jgi:DNA-directed RNA polymerase subunit M/transcription elongation factor TFIIS